MKFSRKETHTTIPKFQWSWNFQEFEDKEDEKAMRFVWEGFSVLDETVEFDNTGNVLREELKTSFVLPSSRLSQVTFINRESSIKANTKYIRIDGNGTHLSFHARSILQIVDRLVYYQELIGFPVSIFKPDLFWTLLSQLFDTQSQDIIMRAKYYHDPSNKFIYPLSP